MQKTFSIPLRLKKWYDNSQKFSNYRKSPSAQIYHSWQEARKIVENNENLE